jgi:uncharacterized membrane protein
MSFDAPTAPRRPEKESAPAEVHWPTRVTGIGLLICFGLVLASGVRGQPLPGPTGWAEALLLVLATVATLVGITRTQPATRVGIAAVLIAAIGSLAHGLGAATSIPFGPFSYGDSIGPRLFGVLAWPVPFLWLVVTLNARGVARMMLRPWRKTRRYGFWVIGVATVLTMLFQLGLDPLVSRVNGYWIWLPTKFAFTWHGMPWTNLLGWGLAALVGFAFATPFLVNQEARRPKRSPNYQPLITWVLALIWFGAVAARHQLWSALIACLLLAMVSSLFALRGARW